MSGLHSNSDSKALPSSQGCGTAGSASLARLCGPAGALCLQVCLGSPCGCVLLCLTHRGLLNTAHGKKNYLRGAFCLTIAKSCPQADPASPAWDSLLPLSLPKAGPALLQGPCYCWGPFPIFDWKCLPITRAMAAMLSSVCGLALPSLTPPPVWYAEDFLIFPGLTSLELPGQRQVNWWIGVAIQTFGTFTAHGQSTSFTEISAETIAKKKN